MANAEAAPRPEPSGIPYSRDRDRNTHFPGYINKGNARGASYFDIGDAWDGLTDAQRWAANQHFLDTIASRGERVLLSLPRTEIRPGSYLAQEVRYLTQERGYVWVNQWALRPGG